MIVSHMFDIYNVKCCLNGNAYNGISSLSDKLIQDFALGKVMTFRRTMAANDY